MRSSPAAERDRPGNEPASGDGVARGKQAIPNDKRRRILDAAVQAFGTHGYSRTRISDIA